MQYNTIVLIIICFIIFIQHFIFFLNERDLQNKFTVNARHSVFV